MSEQPATAQASRAELAGQARAHYLALSDAACHYLSTIPAAIDAWERLPELEATIAAQAARLAAAEQALRTIRTQYGAKAAAK